MKGRVIEKWDSVLFKHTQEHTRYQEEFECAKRIFHELF